MWQLTESSLDGESLDAQLPAERGLLGEPRREPWLFHSMDVSALNFCAFASCVQASITSGQVVGPETLIAVPNALDSGSIDFFRLPSERRVSVLKADPKVKTGMVMALDLFYHPETGLLMVLSGYEDGQTMLHEQQALSSSDDKWEWTKVLTCRPHSQPILSLDSAPSKDFYFTSSADAVIAKFTVPVSSFGADPNVRAAKINNTKHAGQQDLTVRNDGKILATAGWDARVRVYSTKTLRELAVLKWHTDGCYSIAFAEISIPTASPSETKEEGPLLASPNVHGDALGVIKRQRSLKAQQMHWLAAGGKDGKISLWDIY